MDSHSQSSGSRREFSRRQTALETPPKPKWGTRIRNGITLFVVAVVLVTAWMTYRLTMRHRTVEALERIPAYVRYDYEIDNLGKFREQAQPRGPQWLRRLFGNVATNDIVKIEVDCKLLGEWGRISPDFAMNAFLARVERVPNPELVTVEFFNLDPSHLALLADHQASMNKFGAIRVTFVESIPLTDTLICQARQLKNLKAFNVAPTYGLDNLSSCAVGIKGIDCLAELRELRSLSLCSWAVNDEQLAKLASLRYLETLELFDTAVTGEGLRALANLPLETLYLPGAKLDDAGLAPFSEFPRLRNLVVKGCPIEGPGLAFIDDDSLLMTLDLSDTSIDDQALLHIGRAPRLEELLLANCRITDEGLLHLHPLTRLKSIDLTGTDITEAGVDALQQALPDTTIAR